MNKGVDLRAGRARMEPRPDQRGFTLVELLVTITVMVILLTIAVPSFNDAVLGSRLSSFANNLVASTQLARSEAIKRNASVTLCVSSNSTSCGSGGWEQGWIVLSGANVLQRQQALPSGLKVTESEGTNSLTFPPTGVGATPATLTVCRNSPVGSQERVVSINAAGSATVTTTHTGSCP